MIHLRKIKYLLALLAALLIFWSIVKAQTANLTGVFYDGANHVVSGSISDPGTYTFEFSGAIGGPVTPIETFGGSGSFSNLPFAGLNTLLPFPGTCQLLNVRIISPATSNTVSCLVNSAGYCLPDPDNDSDGISNCYDVCPAQGDTGTGVDANGCPNPGPTTPDRDADSIADNVDMCPDNPGPSPHGCPDSDLDGVHDGIDQCPNQGDQVYGVNALGCPNTPLPTPPRNPACPNDPDGDCVEGAADRCPYVDGRGSFNGGFDGADGCPVDCDGDGTYDGLDPTPRLSDRSCVWDNPAFTPIPITAEPTPPPCGSVGSDVRCCGCPPPSPTPPPEPENCSVGAFSSGVRIRSEANSNSNAVGMMRASDEWVRVLERKQVGSEDWYRVGVYSVEGGIGWVSGEVANVSSGCDNFTSTPSPIDNSVIIENCPDKLENFNTFSMTVQAVIVSRGDPCGVLAFQIRADMFGGGKISPSDISVDQFANCPDQLPRFVNFLTDLEESAKAEGGRSTAEIIAAIEDYLETGACGVGTGIIIPPNDPSQDIPEQPVVECIPGISDEHLSDIESLINQLGIPDEILTAENRCDFIRSLVVLGEPSQQQVDIFNRQIACEVSYYDALNVVIGTALTGSDLSGLAWSEVTCDAITQLLVSRIPEGNISFPTQLEVCPLLLVNLFITNHLETLYNLSEEAGVSGGRTAYWNAILQSPEPCKAMQDFIVYRKLPSIVIVSPPVIPIPVPLPPTNVRIPSAPPNFVSPYRPQAVVQQTPSPVELQGLVQRNPNVPAVPPVVQGIILSDILQRSDIRNTQAIYLGNPINNPDQTWVYQLQEAQIQQLQPKLPEYLQSQRILSGVINESDNTLYVFLLAQEINTGVNSIWAVRIASDETVQGIKLVDDTAEYQIPPDTRIDILLSNPPQLFFTLQDLATGQNNIFSQDLGSGESYLIVENGFNPSVSVDGTLLAYERQETGQNNIYLRVLEEPGIQDPPVNQNEQIDAVYRDNCTNPTFYPSQEAIGTHFLTCSNGNDSQLYIYRSSGLRRIELGGYNGIIRNLRIAPSNSLDLLTFDDGETLYYTFVNTAIYSGTPVEILAQESAMRLFGLSWLKN